MNLLVKFSAVGVFGFAIEAVLLTWLVESADLTALRSRFISFPVAVAATWWLNRRMTFRSTNAPAAEGVRYLMVQLTGALTNFMVFAGLVTWLPFMEAYPTLSLGIGAVFGLAINFTLSKKIVFVRHARQR